MFSTRQKLEMFLWAMVPGAIALLMLLLVAAPKPADGISKCMPMLPLLCVYYWGIRSPRLMSNSFLFVLGLIQDALIGLPLGVSSLLFLVFRALLLSQRRFMVKQGFLVHWFVVSILLLGATISYWLVLSFYYQTPLVFAAASVQWMVSVAVYPLLHEFFQRIYPYVARSGSALTLK